MNKEVEKELFNLADEKYKEFQSGLCPNTNNIIGVRVPILRNYAKEIIKKDWREYLETIEDKYYEEIMLQGMIIGLAKMNDDERTSYVKKFIPKIDNWAICDTFCAELKFTNSNLETMWEIINEYLNSNKEFEIRFAVVMIINFYIRDEYIDKVLERLNNIKNKEYYVEMAVAWAISIAYIKYSKKTMKLLKNNNLDDFTYNKALQKIIESYRVTKAEKEKIKKMKRK